MVAGKLKSLVRQFAAPANPWRPDHHAYPLLAMFEPAVAGLAGLPGLMAVWHLGVRPQWLKVAASADLAVSIAAAARAGAITSYRPNGGVYLAWAPLARSPALPGHTVHLARLLSPRLQALRLEAELTVAADTPPQPFPAPPGTG